MSNSDLKTLLDKIKLDSMCRDRVFYDDKMDKKEFFRLIKELLVFFSYYLENEDEIINYWDESKRNNFKKSSLNLS